MSGSAKKKSLTKKAPKERKTSSGDVQLHRLHLWQFQAIRDVLFVAAIVGIIWLGYALRAVTVPLLVAIMLAYLFEPLIVWMISRSSGKMNRIRAVSLLLISVGGSFLILLALLIPVAAGQTAGLIQDFSDGTMRSSVARLSPHIPSVFHDEFENVLNIIPSGKAVTQPSLTKDAEEKESPDKIETINSRETINDEKVREIVRDELEIDKASSTDSQSTDILYMAGKGWATARNLLASIVSYGLVTFLIPFYFFFFSIGFPAVLRFGERLMPHKNKQRILVLISKMDRVISNFVRGRIVISLIMGVMLAVGWWICGVPYAIALGLLIGVFSIVPYLGGIGVPVAWALLFFSQLALPVDERTYLLGWFGVFLWPAFVFGIVQIIEGYILIPKIAGKATNLDPVTIVVVVLAGGTLLGVYGMLLAIPFAACGKILLTDVLFPKIDAWLKGEISDPLPIDRGD